VLDDFFDLGAVQGFVLLQSFCDAFEVVAIRHEGRPGELISVILQFPHLLVDLLRTRFAVVAGTIVARCIGNARSIPGGHTANQLPPFTRKAQGGQDFSYAILRITQITYCQKKESARIAPPPPFDHVGTFGFDMIVTCREGNVFRVHGDGTFAQIAGTFGIDIEGPAVVPSGFGPHGGEIWVADEDGNAVHAVKNTNPPGPGPYTVFPNILSHVNPEGVFVIPSPPCAFCDSPGGPQRLLPGGTTAIAIRLAISAKRLRRVGWQRYRYE